jgi:hypothetical protein
MKFEVLIQSQFCPQFIDSLIAMFCFLIIFKKYCSDDKNREEPGFPFIPESPDSSIKTST